MEKSIKAVVYNDGERWCAKCLEIDVFTQGDTIDEVVRNLKEAVCLHLEGVELSGYGLSSNPSLLIMIEESELVHA